MKGLCITGTLLLLVACQSQEPSPLLEQKLPFDAGLLGELKPFGSHIYKESSQWLVVAYVPTLSCNTCTNRDLNYFSEMQNRLGSKADFVVVCNPGNKDYVRNLRRIAKIDFPILIEEQELALGLVSHFHFHLVDKANDTSVLQFYTAPTIELEDGMMPFETKVLKMLGEP